MPLIANDTGLNFRPYEFSNEKEFEKTVVKLSDLIFGPSSIYVDAKKRIAGNNVISIPDGYLIDLTDATKPTLYVVENEIAKHDPFKHIGVQLLRFAISYEGVQARIKSFLMEAITNDRSSLERLEDACSRSSSRNIDSFLEKAVYADFKALVIIDHASSELNKVLEKIRAEISVLEVKAFESEEGEFIYSFDTLYDEFDDEEVGPSAAGADKADRKARKERRARSDTIIVPAHEEGFREVFLGENQWRAIRVGAAMKDRIKYIAAYQIRPVSAVTHIAKVKEIKPYRDTGKYVVIFDGTAEEIKPIPLKEPNKSPQSPVYAERDKLMKASFFEEALK